MIDFIKKYDLFLEIDKEKVFIYDEEDGHHILTIELKDKSIEFNHINILKFDFIKDLIEVVEKLL